METAEQIRVKMAEIKLAALETEYCNANWTISSKLKALREELHQKNRKQADLTAQLAALKQAYNDHQEQIKTVMAQASSLQEETRDQSKKSSNSPSLRETIKRVSPKIASKGLFFRVIKEDKNKSPFSPKFSKGSPSASYNSTCSNNDKTQRRMQRSKVAILKEPDSLRTYASEKVFESSRTVGTRQENPQITRTNDRSNGQGPTYRRMEKRQLKQEKKY